MKYKVGTQVNVGAPDKGTILSATDLGTGVFYAFSYRDSEGDVRMGVLTESELDDLNPPVIPNYVGMCGTFNGGKTEHHSFLPCLVDVYVKVVDQANRRLLIEFPDYYEGTARWSSVSGDYIGLHGGIRADFKKVQWWCDITDVEFED